MFIFSNKVQLERIIESNEYMLINKSCSNDSISIKVTCLIDFKYNLCVCFLCLLFLVFSIFLGKLKVWEYFSHFDMFLFTIYGFLQLFACYDNEIS